MELTSSEQKSDESSNLEFISDSGQNNTDSDESSYSENTSDAIAEQNNSKGNASKDVVINASDSSNPEDEDASSKNTAEAEQNENEGSVQRETSENENGGEIESVVLEKEKEDSANLDGHSNSDSSIPEDIKESRVDLGTLPETSTESNHNDDTATE